MNSGFRLTRMGRIAFVFLFILSVQFLSAIDYLTEGEKALANNDLKKAQTYLEAALTQSPTNDRVYLQLGLTYQKLSIPAEAKKMFKKGVDLEGPNQYLLAYNLGVSSFSQNDYEGADAAYSQSLTLRPNFSDAFLNRGNTRLQLKRWKDAASDLTTYQTLAPSNPQKEKIDQVIALLNKVESDEEAAKLAEVARKKQEEEDRKALELAQKQKDEAAAAALLAKQEEEKQRAAEEAKRQEEILARIRDSLQGVGGDAKALTTKPAGVKSEDGDFSLEP